MRVMTIDDPAFSAMPDLAEPRGAPSYVRIEGWLTAAITAGDLVPGDKLPPEGDLAAALGVSRMTLRQALSGLESRGAIDRRRGRSGGTFVARPRIECDLTGLPGFTEQMRRANVRAGARVVRAEVTPAPAEVRAALALGRGARVFEIVRVRSANREPLALEQTYLPVELFDGLLGHRLNGSLYALMKRAYGLAPHNANEWLEPVLATAEHASMLGIEQDSALMLVTRTAYTGAGQPVEHAYDRYRADRTRIALQTGIAHGA